jgi:hypothetical protein
MAWVFMACACWIWMERNGHALRGHSLGVNVVVDYVNMLSVRQCSVTLLRRFQADTVNGNCIDSLFIRLLLYPLCFIASAPGNNFYLLHNHPSWS